MEAAATEMVTIRFQRKDGSPLEYKAGQFLTFLFVFGGRELRRSYSFSSTPGVDALPSITLKRVANGEVSRFLIDHLRVGDVLVSLPPAGKFILEEVAGRKLVFLAAGSGMVPVFSLIKEVARRAETARLEGVVRQGRPEDVAPRTVLITQNRDVASIPFREELERMREAGALEWDSLLSGVAPVVRLNNGLLQEMLKDIRGDEYFYLCGPLGFMRMAVFTLRLLGVAEEQIRRENFTVEYVPPPPVLADTSPKRVVVWVAGAQRPGGGDAGGQDGAGGGWDVVGGQEIVFETAWPSTILQSALDRGIALPYSCKGGVCSTCVARCVKGRVKMSKNEVLTEKDLSEGLVLTCVGYAETDVELELGNG